MKSDFTHLNDIIILEDTIVDFTFLQRITQKLLPYASIRHAHSIERFKQLFEQARPTLIICDIELGHENSLDFFNSNQILEDTPLIITSNHPEFAVPAFRLKAFHYLEKPVKMSELSEAFERIEAHYKARTFVPSPQGSNNLMVNTDKFISFLNMDEIVQLTADGPYTHIRQENGKITIVSKNLGSYEAKLPAHFVRVNKSVIINMRFVDRIRKDNTVIELRDHPPVEISVRRKVEVMEQIKKFFAGEL